MRQMTLITFMVLFWASVAMAGIITYIDDAGQEWYVDRIEAIPQKYRQQLTARQRAKLSGGGISEGIRLIWDGGLQRSQKRYRQRD